MPPRRHSPEPVLPLEPRVYGSGQKKRLEGDTQREASTSEVKELRKENSHLKEALAEEILEHRLLKKSDVLDGEDDI